MDQTVKTWADSAAGARGPRSGQCKFEGASVLTGVRYLTSF
jgi:hypothetical protein